MDDYEIKDPVTIEEKVLQELLDENKRLREENERLKHENKTLQGIVASCTCDEFAN